MGKILECLIFQDGGSSDKASSENDLGRSSTIKFLHGQSDAPEACEHAEACRPATGARGSGARDPLTRLAGAEAGL